MEKKMTSMRISERNVARLSAIGKYGDSLNDILDRVLDLYEEIKSERLIEEKMR